jgi:hypothetical protein
MSPAPVFCPPLMFTPPTGCLIPVEPEVSPRTPTIIPERMPEQPKTDPKKLSAQPEPPNAGFATPVAAETPDPKPNFSPLQNTTEKIPPPAVPKTTDLPKFALPAASEPAKQPSSLPALDIPPPKVDAAKPNQTPKTPGTLPTFNMVFPNSEVAQPVEANKPSVSRSSPLTEKRTTVADVYAVAGSVPVSNTSTRAVGFVNKSNRDLLLTINGKIVTLPTKNVLRAELPASFRWQVGDEDERTVTVPPSAPGVDIVIR